MADEFDKERFDRYIQASKSLDDAVAALADATEGYWGNFVTLRSAIQMLIRARNCGALAPVAVAGDAICEANERLRKRIPPHGPRRAA